VVKTLAGHGFAWSGRLQRPAGTRFDWVGAS
jgi:hypothetical protein